jgi:hypothetical protein
MRDRRAIGRWLRENSPRVNKISAVSPEFPEMGDRLISPVNGYEMPIVRRNGGAIFLVPHQYEIVSAESDHWSPDCHRTARCDQHFSCCVPNEFNIGAKQIGFF